MSRAALLALAVSAAAAHAAPALQVVPAQAVEGDPVAVRISGLAAGQVVTLHSARVFERYPAGDEPYRGRARFVAAADGSVDVMTAVPLPGSAYAAADPAGPFWSMMPVRRDAAGELRARELGLVDASTLPAGSVALALEVDGRIVARAVAQLDIAAAGLVVREVRSPGVVGVFAQRPGGPPQPAVLVLGGSEGGLFTARSLVPRLASRGFAVLGLATFQGSDPEALPVPGHMEHLPLETLAAARRWLQAQPGVGADVVAVVGVSKGAEMALLAATHYPWIKAVAAFAPSHVVWEGMPPRGGSTAGSSWTIDGRALPYVRWLPDAERRATQARQLTGSSRLTEVHLEALAEHAADVAAATIPVERAQAALLLAAGIDDAMWPAAYAAQRIAARLAGAGYRHPVQLELVPTGHQLLGTGWAPTTAFQRGSGRLQGGNAALDAAAQAALWNRLLAFLRTHLP